MIVKVSNTLTRDKKNIATLEDISYLHQMKNIEVQEDDLAALAKKYREASGKNRAQAAHDLNVSRQSIIYAEDRLDESLYKLRKRIIETYSPYKVVGPIFRLEKIREAKPVKNQ